MNILAKKWGLKIVIFSVLLISTYFIAETNINKPMKLQPNQTAPSFSTIDIKGNQVSSTTLKGKKVALIFERFVGCPICNLHVHQLMKVHEQLQKKGIILVVVYESSKENLLQFATVEEIPFVLLPDPDGVLYKTFELETSLGKVMNGILFKGAFAKVKAGEKLYKGKYKNDGKMSRLEADFLINEKGIINKAYYAKFVGDHLPIEEIMEF